MIGPEELTDLQFERKAVALLTADALLPSDDPVQLLPRGYAFVCGQCGSLISEAFVRGHFHRHTRESLGL